MIAKLQKGQTPAANEPRVLETSSGEAPMIAQHADCPMVERHDPSGRLLRNRIILANAIAWIAIIALVRLLFF